MSTFSGPIDKLLSLEVFLQQWLHCEACLEGLDIIIITIITTDIHFGALSNNFGHYIRTTQQILSAAG